MARSAKPSGAKHPPAPQTPPVSPAAAGAGDVAGERGEKNLRALGEIGVEKLALSPLRQNERRRRCGKFTGETPDDLGVDAGDVGDLLGFVAPHELVFEQ